MPRPSPLRVLIVDDDDDMRLLLGALLATRDDVAVAGEACDGVEAILRYDELEPDVVVMDVEMPRLSGSQAVRRILALHPDARILAHTGHIGAREVTAMIVAGAVGYTVKGADADKLVDAIVNAYDSDGHIDPEATPGLYESVVDLARAECERREEIERLHDQLEASYQDTVRALAAALRSKDDGTCDHVDRVTQWAVAVGRRLGLAGDDLRDVEYGAIFHDIGKIAVPDAILHNTDALDEGEWQVIKQHTVWGERIIQPVGFLRNVARIVRHSHEHWDGSGYPDGLVGNEIPLASRIILCCDAFDAMTSERSYQEAMPARDAIERLRDLRGVRFDPQVADALVDVVDQMHLLDGHRNQSPASAKHA